MAPNPTLTTSPSWVAVGGFAAGHDFSEAALGCCWFEQQCGRNGPPGPLSLLVTSYWILGPSGKCVCFSSSPASPFQAQNPFHRSCS